MSFVHTAFGRGQIVGEETVRGRKQYLVAGNGFKLWVDEADAQIHTGAADFDFEPAEDVNEENSTDLPYNPEPQFPVEGFSDEQTIQPNHELDADDRLSPADSLTFEDVEDREYPGPGEHLFARRTASEDDEPRIVMIRNGPGAEPLGEFVEEEDDDPGWEGSIPLDHLLDHFGIGDTLEEQFPEKFAGLSDKYIDITADVDHYNDPVVRFRDDPIREINRLAHSLSDVHDDDRMEHYAALVDSDSHIREAAWSDVRQKAQRIRREGKMDVHDIDNNQIYATVHGDHGDYDVMIVKGGLGGNSITQWTCTCDWGRHAFKRKVLHVGRLCSHGLAGWLEMQSQELSDVAKKHPYKKRADVVDDYKSFNDEYNDGHVDKATADNFISRPHQAGGIEPMEPEDVDKLYNYVEDNKTQPGRRNYEIPYTLDPDKAYKQAEVLRTSPHSLTPDLKFLPKGEDEHFVDVEEDERETTGPDQIVHFSNRRRYAGEEVEPEPYRDFDGGGELLDELREESSTPLEEDFGNMRDRNDDVREIVEELREKGYDADQFVASRRTAADVGHFMKWREQSPAQAYGAHDAADMYAEEHGLDDYELQDLHDWIDITHGRHASYGVGNQGAGPGGAFGQPGGGNWADHPFAGSGPDPKFWYESSEDYVDAHERPRYEDVTDLGDDDIIKYTKDKPQQGKKASVEDPIEAFYKSGAADAIKGGGSSRGGGSFSDDAIAANAQSFLMRTAGRNYSLAEQRELEDEEHHLGARNLDGLDLAGTHYISDL